MWNLLLSLAAGALVTVGIAAFTPFGWVEGIFPGLVVLVVAYVPLLRRIMKKLEALKPDSNGLLFLRGEAARDRDNDHSEASKLFSEALKRDPKFVRSQVALLVLQRDMSGMWTEMKKLTAMNPKHQMVVWMGPVVKSAYDEWAEVQRRRTASNFNRALPGAEK